MAECINHNATKINSTGTWNTRSTVSTSKCRQHTLSQRSLIHCRPVSWHQHTKCGKASHES